MADFPLSGGLDTHQLILLFGVLSVIFVLVKLANQTDIPKIKNLPELPGVPVFGSLLHLGKHHARNCAKYAKTYGDVFQARLGNRVSDMSVFLKRNIGTDVNIPAIHLCQLL